jgi:hypothetical protein
MTSDFNRKSPIVSSLHPETPVLLVLLGASNLSRGCFALVKHIKSCLYPRKVDVLIASGPGRAYYTSGGLLNVSYPPIYASDIFEVAQNKSKSGYQVVALVTDIGNDIMYGVSEIFYTTLPVAFEKGDHPVWFCILRSLLFPRSTVAYDEATAGIIEVNRFLKESACRQGRLIPDMDRYLGYDEIHYGWLRAHNAWSHVARIILGTLGFNMTSEITLPRMIRSYWEELRQVVGTDMTGFKKKKPEHF